MKTMSWKPARTVNLNDPAFIQNKYQYYEWLRREAPVYRGKFGVLRTYLVSRYDDCEFVLKDPRFVRANSNRFLSWVMPSTLKTVMDMMLYKDGEEHRRLRNLVQKAFTPRAIESLHGRIEETCESFLDQIEANHTNTFDLVPTYAYPLPVNIIGGLLGIEDEDMEGFQENIAVILDGLSGMRIIKTILWDFRKTISFIERIIEKKRANPKEDMLTGLIQAEEDGDKLSQKELVSMVVLLVIAGYETTVDLLKCATITLLSHPEQLEQLKANPELMGTAIEEVMRYLGPIQGTEFIHTSEQVTIRDVVIPKGHFVSPLLGSANRDPEAFDDPDTFDITRKPNRHLGFGKGIHYCLGAHLARLEAKIALQALFNRFPNLRLAQPADELPLRNVPLFHRFKEVPLVIS
jgi:cytochrome P450